MNPFEKAMADELAEELRPEEGESPVEYLERLAKMNQAELDDNAQEGFVITGIEEMRRSLFDDVLIEKFLGKPGMPDRVAFEVRFQREVAVLLGRARDQIRLAKEQRRLQQFGAQPPQQGPPVKPFVVPR